MRSRKLVKRRVTVPATHPTSAAINGTANCLTWRAKPMRGKVKKRDNYPPQATGNPQERWSPERFSFAITCALPCASDGQRSAYGSDINDASANAHTCGPMMNALERMMPPQVQARPADAAKPKREATTGLDGKILGIIAPKTLDMRGQVFIKFKEIASPTNAM